MALASTLPGSVAQVLAERDACFDSFVNALKLIITCKDFDKKVFKKRPLDLSEAYVLVWHNTSNSTIDGKSNMNLRVGASAAVLLDLMVREKIEIADDDTHLGCDQHCDLAIKVLNVKSTKSYLDYAGFKQIVNYHEKNHGKRYLVKDWFEDQENQYTVKIILRNLVERKIIGDVQTGMCGIMHKYPTKDASFETALDTEMKQVSLKECKPDSFMLALLTLSRTADHLFTFIDPILRKHFTKDEYKVAKENIKVIVQSQGEVLRSPKLDRKKKKNFLMST